MRRLVRRPLIVVLIVAVLLLVGKVLGQSPKGSTSASSSATATSAAPRRAPQRRTAGEPLVRDEADLKVIDDPVSLNAAGHHWLKAGNRDLARKCFEAAIVKHEVNLYDELAGTPWAEALVHERMGELDEAEKIWRASFESDLQTTLRHIARWSRHPKRGQLLADGKSYLLELVDKAKRGEKAVIYITKKGAKRYLEVITQEQAEEAFTAGERLSYVYLDELDLKGRTWPKRVGCQRCVVGKISAWEASFEDQFDFNGFALGDVVLGKHWQGEVNKSSFDPPATFNRLYLDRGVFFGKVDMDSITVTGRVANFPSSAFLGETNFRQAQFDGTAEFRLTHFDKPANFKSARFRGSVYFSYASFAGLDLSRVRVYNRPIHFASAIFAGDLLIEDAIFSHPVTFENARFDGNVVIRRCKFEDQLHLSRAVTRGDFLFQRNEAKDILMYGGQVHGRARFDSCYLTGRAYFSLDELTRREHLEDVTPLHKLYKVYQGDDDAEEDLTSTSQYGVTDIDDLVSRFYGRVSFANTYFRQFVGFERVEFGSEDEPGYADFYNAQFGAEAHFERAQFHGIADFRTVGGAELSFNQAQFHTHWLLDDANVPGRLSMHEADLLGDATVSLSGADIRSFGIDSRQLFKDPDEVWRVSGHRLFYERCTLTLADGDDPAPFVDDPRLIDAKWDPSGEKQLVDPGEIAARAEEICINRTVDEYVRLRDSFKNRSMSDEADWAYWHVKHYANHRSWVNGGVLDKANAFFERMLFEKAFGWGVLLGNLGFTSAVVILFFAVLKRLLCGNMEVIWDGEPTTFRELSFTALIVISMHSFLGGFGSSESLLESSSSTYKYVFTAEIMVGIIVITFFIGAYTQLVLG